MLSLSSCTPQDHNYQTLSLKVLLTRQYLQMFATDNILCRYRNPLKKRKKKREMRKEEKKEEKRKKKRVASGKWEDSLQVSKLHQEEQKLL